MKAIPFKIDTKTIKYPRINLTKEVQGLYNENLKSMMQ
jgi:hypothetical protein